MVFILFPERVRAALGAAVLWGNSGVTALSAHPRSPESLGLLPVTLLMAFLFPQINQEVSQGTSLPLEVALDEAEGS